VVVAVVVVVDGCRRVVLNLGDHSRKSGSTWSAPPHPSCRPRRKQQHLPEEPAGVGPGSGREEERREIEGNMWW